MFLFENIQPKNKKIAIITNNNEKISYNNLFNLIDQFSLSIKKERQLILLLCKNNLETVTGYLSFIKNNNIVLLVDERINEILLKKLTSTYKPDYIFLPKDKKINDKNFRLYKKLYDYILLKNKHSVKKNINDNLMALVSTSGSTGSPKLVRLSYQNFSSNILSVNKSLPINKNDITITTLPMSYVYGLSIINSHFYEGCTINLNEKSFVDADFWRKMEKNKINSFGGVPYNYQIIDRLNLEKFDLSNLRYSTLAGGKLNNQILSRIIKKYKKLKLQLISMYGASEATARMSYLSWNKAKKKIGSIGKPIEGGKFFIKDAKGKIITKANKEGELVYKGKNVCMGYAEKKEDLNLPDINQGLLNTGDIGFKDKDGFYFVIGRKDRIIKIFGNRVNLNDIDDLSYKYGYETISANLMENKITVYVKKSRDINILKEKLNLITNIHISAFQFKEVDELPINLNNKFSLKN